MNGFTFAVYRRNARWEQARSRALDVIIHRLGPWRSSALTDCEHNYRARRIRAAMNAERLSFVPYGRLWDIAERLEKLAKEVGV